MKGQGHVDLRGTLFNFGTTCFAELLKITTFVLVLLSQMFEDFFLPVPSDVYFGLSPTARQYRGAPPTVTTVTASAIKDV